jgi:hypothetical protein
MKQLIAESGKYKQFAEHALVLYIPSCAPLFALNPLNAPTSLSPASSLSQSRVHTATVFLTGFKIFCSFCNYSALTQQYDIKMQSTSNW